MKKSISLLFILVVCLLSCEKPEKTGDLNVTVVINGYYPVENARVYTQPSTKEGTTDEFGTVLLKGIEIGSYEVYASLESVGSGKSAINIKEDELSSVTVNIIEGVIVDEAPEVSIMTPDPYAEFSENDTIYFSAIIEDDKTLPQDIAVKWESDLDGVIHSGHPDNTGLTSFYTHTLSKGVHVISLSAKDEDDYETVRSIQISTDAIEGVTLYTPVISGKKVVLEWSQFALTDFLKYEVYRTDESCSESSADLLATITSIGTTTYSDSTYPFAYQACYFIRVTNIQNDYRNSNHELVDLPSGHIFNFIPYDFLKHPTQTFVYLLDQGGHKIVKFDYQQMEVTDQVNLEGTIGFCDIGDNGFGVEIYAPSSDGWIYVYDADDLNLSFKINTGLATASCVINGLGHVIASVDPDPWWEMPVRSYSRATGINIDGNGDFERDRLRRIPGKNEIISISTTVSPVDMEYFKLDENGFIVQHQDDQYHGDYPLHPYIFRISDNAEYAITSTSGAVYLANSSMEYKGLLQSGTLLYSDFAFSDDGSVIYAATSNRKSVQIGHYPSLIRDDEILTRGFPKFIIREGQRLILLSKAEEESVNSGIEIVDIQAQ